MLMNFCNSVLKPKVKSSCLCNEEYDVTNLISSNYLKYSRGFVAYVVVKPPVFVEFEFVCPVNVSHVIIWSEVGGQKSSGLELFSKHERNDTAAKIGWAMLRDGQPGVVFHQGDVEPGQVPAGFVCTLLSERAAPLRNVRNVVVRIFKTRSSVPALGRVEVWGEVSKSAPPALRASVLQLWGGGAEPPRPAARDEEERKRPSHTDDGSRRKRPACVVPEDFLDSLTYEVMALPMILPCGKAVDRSTLERHEQCEASWGRSPSDPFTGKPYTRTVHPMLDSSLKSRIDLFLLEHADEEEVRRLPRTLPRSRQAAKKPCVEEKYLNPRQLVATEERDDDKNLDAAMERALSRLPSFLHPVSSRSVRDPDPFDCGRCNRSEELYSLPCKHLLCRACLFKCINDKDLTCKVCASLFTTDGPVRWHCG
ncbi:hypothetical protein PR048_031999 [Dryococelus australis]|uniref:U-box domain-containing protein n=1 Tax=Dryococelus australis TaxID=614101 RepID=A0ABQ9G6V1_9NEOP|nr:hypothetical protein PR048_031999 [Dryococelus australis]